MISTEVEQWSQTVETLRAAANAALTSGSPEEFELVEREISLFAAQVREAQQGLWRDQAKQAIKNLEGGKPLTPADVDVIRTFLISDAQHYVALENNYQDWVRELNRLFDDIASRIHTVDEQSIADLRGVLKDAIRLVPDISNYLDENRRIRQFESALSTLDAPSRQLMARILREQLNSPTQ